MFCLAAVASNCSCQNLNILKKTALYYLTMFLGCWTLFFKGHYRLFYLSMQPQITWLETIDYSRKTKLQVPLCGYCNQMLSRKQCAVVMCFTRLLFSYLNLLKKKRSLPRKAKSKQIMQCAINISHLTNVISLLIVFCIWTL